MSQNIKKFSIVTVCKNSKDLIEETILSVVNQTIFQKKLATLEYIIIDGYSTDGTTNIILDLKKKYSQILHFTEEDNSLFDGLTKGLKKCTGDFVAYINAGDFYNNTAFEIVNNVFNKNLDNGINIFHQESEFYEAMCLLKTNQIELAKAQLQRIADNNGFYSIRAMEVLSKQ